MENAHLRLGLLEYVRITEKASTRTEPAATQAKKSAEGAPKPAEARKQEPAHNASLFDIGQSRESAPSSASDTDEEEEILAKIAEGEPADEAENLDDAA